MKRLLTTLLSAAIMLSALAGCGAMDTTPEQTTTQQAADISAPDMEADNPNPSSWDAAPAAPSTVTDLTGRTVELPGTVERVAALGSASRMLTYAGCADHIVGCTDLEKEGQPGMPYAYVNKDHFAGCASIASGGSGDTLYGEELAVLEPDLIFYFGADRDTLDQLQNQMGVPVVGLYATNFYDEDFRQTLRLIGNIMGTEEHVDTLIAALEGWIADLKERTQDIPQEERPSVYTGALGFRGAHGFEGTSAQFPPFVAVNANNVVDETGETGTLLIDLEKVTDWDPEYIFLNPQSMYLVNEDYEVNPAFYDNLSAVKNNRVYSLVSYNYNWTNQELAIADAYYVGSILYPEQFSDVDFRARAEEIFHLMLGCDYLDVLEQAGTGFGPLTIGE
ncbi:MAG: ABC transporter substrate-binding protein [Lachnospiraceae bacterium]|nr:ABC transporter substrate-binding protein [Lachnospiraceae bacterium]